MEKVPELRTKAKKLRQLLQQVESVPGVGNVSERERDAQRKRQARAASKTVVIPPCEDRERRERLEQDDEAWLYWYYSQESGTINPFTYRFTEQQREMIAAIRYAFLHGEDQSIAASRGEGKSTIAERMIIKYTLQGIIPFAVLFAATGASAENSLDTIKTDIEANERLYADYPEVCVPVRALDNTPNRAHYQLVSGKRHDNGEVFEASASKFTWCGQQIIFPKVPGSPSSAAIVATRGLDSAVRGLKIRGRRPKVALIDDPDTQDTARSEEQAKLLIDKIDAGIAALGGQTYSIARVMLTTIQSRICASYIFTDPTQKQSWKPKRFRFLVEKPVRMDMWMEWIELKKEDWLKGTNNAHQMYLDNFDEMNRGAAVSNANRYTKTESTALEFYFREVARLGQEKVSTEYDNDPPADEKVQSLILTAYHVQNSLSGIDRRIVPDETICLARAGDVSKLGLHWVAVAFNAVAAGVIVDYDFFEFGTENRKASDCELQILEGLFRWQEAQAEIPYYTPDGSVFEPDLTLIDTGWKDESWNNQPVQQFCSAMGYRWYMPSKGKSPYFRPNESDKLIIGDNWHITVQNSEPIVLANSDHWKLKVHEGFLSQPGQPGSLMLFDPPRVDGRKSMTCHLSFAKHILSETWETRFQPGFHGKKTGWWKSPKPNHYFDALYNCIVARSMCNISTLPGAPVTQTTAETHQQQEPVTTGVYSRERW